MAGVTTIEDNPSPETNIAAAVSLCGPIELDISPYSDETLWTLKDANKWDTLSRILHPVTNDDFCVKDVVSRLLVGDGRKKFDQSVGDSQRGLVYWILFDSSEKLSWSDVKRIEILKQVLSAGLNPDLPEANGWRPSHYCGSQALVHLTPMIFFCRPDMQAKNVNGHTPLQAAKKLNYMASTAG